MLRDIKKGLASGNPAVLLAAFLYFDTSFMLWVLPGALGNYIADDLGLSTTEKGLLTATPILSGVALRLVMGALGDGIGGRQTGLLGMGLTFIPLLLGWLVADSLTSLLAVGLLLGVAGASFAIALPMAGRWYPAQRQGLVMGIAGAGSSGTVIAFLVGSRLAKVVGWHAVFGLAMLPLAAVFAAFAFLAKDSPNRPPPISALDYRAVLSEPDTFRFSLFYAITFGGFVGLGTYLAILLRDLYGVSKVEAADIAAASVFLGSFARPIGGALADRIGGVRVLLGVFLVVAALATAMSQVPPLTIGAGLLLATFATLGLGNGAVFQLLPQRFPRQLGSMTGLVGAAGGVGGFCLPILLSSLTEASDSPGAGLFVFGQLALVGLVLLAVSQRGWRKTWLRESGAIVISTHDPQLVPVPVED